MQWNRPPPLGTNIDKKHSIGRFAEVAFVATQNGFFDANYKTFYPSATNAPTVSGTATNNTALSISEFPRLETPNISVFASGFAFRGTANYNNWHSLLNLPSYYITDSNQWGAFWQTRNGFLTYRLLSSHGSGYYDGPEMFELDTGSITLALTYDGRTLIGYINGYPVSRHGLLTYRPDNRKFISPCGLGTNQLVAFNPKLAYYTTTYFTKCLSSTEILSLHQNPYQYFNYTNKRAFTIPDLNLGDSDIVADNAILSSLNPTISIPNTSSLVDSSATFGTTGTASQAIEKSSVF